MALLSLGDQGPRARQKHFHAVREEVVQLRSPYPGMQPVGLADQVTALPPTRKSVRVRCPANEDGHVHECLAQVLHVGRPAHVGPDRERIRTAVQPVATRALDQSAGQTRRPAAALFVAKTWPCSVTIEYASRSIAAGSRFTLSVIACSLNYFASSMSTSIPPSIWRTSLLLLA